MNEATGILVFTQQSVLDHKLRDGKCSEDRYCYWTTKRFPNRFLDDVTAEARLYFAIDKQVKGYFVITGLYEEELRFCAEDWNPIENGEILVPSQGWRYYMHPE
ncbi:hypothetical protein KAU33_03760 [Candidatus Dependentiae bacterium]|nr:hypothetical protein [Candidatus Dependentiae bacterium]